jgi:hypothetical protein
MVNPYAHSALIKKIQRQKKYHQPLRLAFLDIDATMTGSQQTTNTTRRKLERLGFGVIYVTSRAEEMLMSSQSYQSSIPLGFDRPAPKMGIVNNTHFPLPPESVEPTGILDPDVIAGSTGTQIIVKQQITGYMKDTWYEEQFFEGSAAWRARILGLVQEFNNNSQRAYPAQYDYEDNYLNGITNIYPPKFRIVLYFQSAEHKNAFRSFLKHYYTSPSSKPNIHITDDSNPKKGKFVLCLMPRNASKRKAVDRVIDQVCVNAGVQRADLNVLIAGDSLPDLDMGLRSGKGTNVTFLLVGGSRLSHALTCLKNHSEVFDDQFCELKACMNARKTKGYYAFEHQQYQQRQIIVGDEAYNGKRAVETILSVLPKE